MEPADQGGRANVRVSTLQPLASRGHFGSSPLARVCFAPCAGSVLPHCGVSLTQRARRARPDREWGPPRLPFERVRPVFFFFSPDFRSFRLSSFLRCLVFKFCTVAASAASAAVVRPVVPLHRWYRVGRCGIAHFFRVCCAPACFGFVLVYSSACACLCPRDSLAWDSLVLSSFRRRSF